MTLHQIDSVCDEFEAALRRGDTLIIEDFLPKVDAPQQTSLLKELLEIEIQYVTERSATDSSIRNMQASLQRRFPEHHDLIHSLFQKIIQVRQIGDYEILDEIGRGGMGVVYKGKHNLLQQTVAIKVLSQNLLDDSQAVGRFKREMQLIGGLDHPNIVRALNAGEIDSTLYLAMEFVDGISLHKLVESVRAKNTRAGDVNPPIPPDSPAYLRMPLIPLGAACEAIRQAALGLQNVHELKLVHRDIKPANLMVDYRGTVKILDLGLGKFAEEQREDYHSSLTMAGMVLGTVDYISPEQCENSREADIRSDLYSLGCTFYFLLMGKPVYSGSRYDSMRKKLMGHIVGEVPSLRSVISNIPKGIETVLQKAVAKDPAERFQTPLEFAEALAPFASPDELWTLVQEIVPVDASGTRSSSRHTNSPYASLYATRRDITPSPVRRPLRMSVVVGLCFLFGLAIGAAIYFSNHRFDDDIAKRKEAVQTSVAALELQAQWKMAEAQVELQKAVSLRMADYGKYGAGGVLLPAVFDRTNLAVVRWYQGDSRRAGQDLVSLTNFIDDKLKSNEQSITGIAYLFTDCKADVLERRADFILFGGAASGLNAERFADRISLYNEAVKIRTNRNEITSRMTRWKQVILLALNGDLKKAESLFAENPLREHLQRDTVHMYPKLLHQLAEAVLFYYQSEDGVDRNRELRIFQRLFSAQNNATPETAAQPEILELLLFCQEFLINDWIKHEDWETLAENIYSTSQATANFVRQYPGAIPFMRRFHELLVRSAVLVYDNSERERDKEAQIRNIVRILTQMRPSHSAEMETPTLILFFLPESNKPEESFVVFYPQDGRETTLYPLPLTRQKVKQREATEALPKELLEKIVGETRIRVSWNDESAWSSGENAMTDADYPYGNVLPLR